MSMVSANVTVESNAQELEVWVRGVEGILRGGQLMVFMRAAMLPYLQRRARERFSREGDDVSGSWLPLSEATNEIRVREGFPGEHPINQRTHELYNWITHGTTPVIRGGNDWATLDWPGPQPNPALYEKLTTAQRGKSGGRGKDKYKGNFGPTPARPVIGINQRDAAAAISVLTTFFIAQCNAIAMRTVV